MELEARERESSQINSLKIKYNSVFGYFIEVTNVHKDKVPSHYKRKQTLTNAERYVTEELYELETKILSSRGRKLQLEETLFKNLREYILAQGSIILNLAHKWSELDVISSLAWLALEQRYVRPQFSTDAQLRFEGSRHPVIEQSIKKTFVPNTVSLGAGECLLLTGPNMAGKSTLMRQVAITALLAQMGSFVPAASATLPIFQKLFTRIGASDSLAEGLSTFMVEMKETAEMLSEANEHTLVVLDEVGRGTSTYDGMSLAQSILEYLIVEKKCMTLFATHYHELTDLSARYKQVHNAHMSIQETNSNVDDQIQFLYTLKKGPANKSYGIHVARLAGLPNSILKRSQSLLEEHEKRMKCQLELF
jgi:DNA mismatch repair protein MutS